MINDKILRKFHTLILLGNCFFCKVVYSLNLSSEMASLIELTGYVSSGSSICVYGFIFIIPTDFLSSTVPVCHI